MNSTPLINECLARVAVSAASIESFENDVKGLNSLSQNKELLSVFQWLTASVDERVWNAYFPFLRLAALAEDAICFVPLIDKNLKVFSEVLQITSSTHPLSASIAKSLYKIYDVVRFNEELERSFTAAVACSCKYLDSCNLLPALESLKAGVTDEIESLVLELSLVNLLSIELYNDDSVSQESDLSPSLSL